MFNNTFEKISKELKDFFEYIITTNPDFIVPVKKKGCKLLRYVNLPMSLFHEKVRYIDFFKNNNINLDGKRIAVIDDATKYTSMLCKYREYFEDYKAIVDTYSFVGQKKIKTGEREQYDYKAQVYKYLEESTYQEYITQQSMVLSTDDFFYDIDHFVIRTNISLARYEKLIYSFSKIGDVEFTNDFYSPKNIEKISIINIGFRGAETLFGDNVSQGALQKIRLAYNYSNQNLTIAPLSFPTWDSKKVLLWNKIDDISLILPYDENGDSTTKEGIYYDIVYIFHIYLLKFFLEQFSEFSELSNFQIIENDIIACVGENRAKVLIQSAKEFLLNDSISVTNIDTEKLTNRIVLTPRKGNNPFTTVKGIMDELREKYNIMVENANSVLSVRYFLSYEEIIERYVGKENLLKWIDILCDRGVLVTRNYNEKGIYYRACRSGEANYDQIEQRSYMLIPIAINACGHQMEQNDKKYSYINPTYLNKVLANLVYDYPSKEYDFHSLQVKPCYYGPLTYIEDRINDNVSISIYKVNEVSDYCTYDRSKKLFVTFSTKLNDFRNKIKERFGQQDAIPYTEITGYFGFIKYIREYYKTDNFLNAMAICRNENLYCKYIYYNLSSAYRYIRTAILNIIQKDQETNLREAAKNVKSARTKLKYNQTTVYNQILELTPDMVYEQAQQTILDSFEFFSESFVDKTIPVMDRISEIEYFVVNMLLFDVTNDIKYWDKFYKQYFKSALDIARKYKIDIDSLEKMILGRKDWDERAYWDYKKQLGNIVKVFCDDISDKLPLIYNARKFSEQESRENMISAVNKITRFVTNNHHKTLTILYYTFSGYKNIDDQKEIDVIGYVQSLLEKLIVKPKIGKLVYGASDPKDYGLLVVDSYELALEFAIRLMKDAKEYSHVFFRFGCAYVNVTDSDDLKETIKSSLIDAQKCANQVDYRNAFIISKSSFETIKAENVNMDFVSQCVPIGKMKGNYYEYKEVKDMLENVIKYDTNIDESVRIGIITVLLEEHTAMQSMLIEPKTGIFPGKGSGHQFVLGNIDAYGGGTHRIALARTIGDGNNKAAIRAEKLIEHFPNLEVIFMVGIAGGTPLIFEKDEYNESDIKEKHVRLGDVVVGNGIIQYDYIKDKINEVTHKGSNIPPSSRVMEAQQKLQEEYELDDKAPWNYHIVEALERLKDSYMRPDVSQDVLYDYNGERIVHPYDESRVENYPRIFEGKIASANTVLKNPEKRDQLKREHNVYAIEMETSGVADTTWEAGISYYAVRGICDYCDSFKNDSWHKYASLVAAAYVRALIEKIPD